MPSKNKIRVAVIFGGKSAEHEVSIRSAKNIVGALDRKKYDVTLIGIDRKGKWHLNSASDFLLLSENPKLLGLPSGNKKSVALVQQKQHIKLFDLNTQNKAKRIDVVFPVLHGPFGEDGTVQGLLKLMNVPYVGADVLGSAVGMDKDVMKRLLREARIPVAEFLVFHQGEKPSFAAIKKRFDLPFFVKPANLGSSVGISRVEKKEEFQKAVTEAFEFDNKILIEKHIEGREVECSVLGNEKPIASLPGEVIPTHAFYSYEAKYIDKNGARFDVPANLPHKVIEKIRGLAIKTCVVLGIEGMARVDFFLTPRNKIIVNEVNTIPGFTAISMYPKLWQVSGISPNELVDRLIRLALARHQRDNKLKTSYP